ncbi:MAG: 16S rRNA (cytidine(1402)-2'-O)-methyltransferase [Gammaproteobacteria bacterium]|nr:16S rRNA (cytidine(1402)-2'-O)-methyltransferase [Gammaproteobacteria bacterium]
MSPRAVSVLSGVDLIAAEDTRHSAHLLQAFAITTPCQALHEHNERSQTPQLIERLRAGQSLALISDAGTPLLSDPGYTLVRAAQQQGITVIPVPGASALLAALVVAGLPCDRFVFEGFLSSRAKARQDRLQQLAAESRTMVFYEAPHRIVATLADMTRIFGGQREALLARELTKLYETLRHATLQGLQQFLEQDPGQCRGEFVVVVSGNPASSQQASDAELQRVLGRLLEELPLKKAVAVARDLTGEARNRLYDLALQLGASGGE